MIYFDNMLSSAIPNNGSYSNERSNDVEYGTDPAATGSFFSTDYKKHDDLKEMLDSNRDNLKLEAMKRIIGMVAKGRDASELFASVVKNVVSKNIEVKKLVYVYLVRYAEQQQDLALLSISTFQRALKDPNQLIRAGALRVLSSIRVPMIVPIVMLAIRDASVDMSPYVRKTAAHAIPKLHSLDYEQKPELIEIIERLLGDRSILVVGSAVMAFEEVCPERIDLIHRNFRKLCVLLCDVDEWGQVTILNMLTRYARCQFTDPNLNQNDSDKSFYESSDSDEQKKEPQFIIDADHRMLIKCSKSLLQSRNAAVVMAVVELYHHTAPKQDVQLAVKALIRLLRSYKEVQAVVLNVIGAISQTRKLMFEPYLKNFYVRTNDATHVKLLKLNILTNLVTEGNVYMILMELQQYILSSDTKFATAAIQAIGRCAINANDNIKDTCLNGLVTLLSSNNEAIVAESVIVIKQLLQIQAADPVEIIAHMARLMDSITVPQARAAILWLLGEHCAKCKKIAPDVLRKLAKSFVDEQDIVKLQVLNLAVKLWLLAQPEVSTLCQYVFNLARYDPSYDIRDRSRFLKQFILNSHENSILTKRAADVFLVQKPAPQQESSHHGESFMLGSLSHYINARAAGYRDLPPFAVERTSPRLRDAAETEKVDNMDHRESKRSKLLPVGGMNKSSDDGEYFSGDDDKDEEEEGDETSDDDDGTSDDDDDEDEEKSSSESSDDDSEDSETSDGEKNSQPSSDDDDDEKNDPKISVQPSSATKNNLDLLLEYDINPEITSILQPMANTPVKLDVQSQIAAVYVENDHQILVNRINNNGLSVKYRYTRTPHLYSTNLVSIELLFENHTSEPIHNIRIGKKKSTNHVHDFALIGVLQPNATIPAIMGVDFNDSTQSIAFEIVSGASACNIDLKPLVGELIRPISLSCDAFEVERGRLRGLYEHESKVTKKIPKGIVEELVFKTANVARVDDDDGGVKFAGKTLKFESIVLVSVTFNDDELLVNTHCEKVTVGSMLLDLLVGKLMQLEG